jgi:hypothetical protein
MKKDLNECTLSEFLIGQSVVLIKLVSLLKIQWRNVEELSLSLSLSHSTEG